MCLVSYMNDPLSVVYTNGVTQPQWFYNCSKIKFVTTDKDISDYNVFEFRSLVLCSDGIIRNVRKK